MCDLCKNRVPISIRTNVREIIKNLKNMICPSEATPFENAKDIVVHYEKLDQYEAISFKLTSNDNKVTEFFFPIPKQVDVISEQ